MKYIYVIFEDEKGKVFIMRDTQVKTCVFAGSVGEVKEMEKGLLVKSENDNDYLKALFNKQDEYIKKRRLLKCKN